MWSTSLPTPTRTICCTCYRAYGVKVTSRQESGELIVAKVMRKGPQQVDAQTDILDLDRASYPRFADDEAVAKYYVPIQGAYHEKLFPEISFRVPLPLFSAPGMERERTATPRQERTPGKTICEVYLCRALVESEMETTNRTNQQSWLARQRRQPSLCLPIRPTR